MIAETLNRDFVLRQAEIIQKHIQSRSSPLRRGLSSLGTEVDAADLKETAQLIEEAIKNEKFAGPAAVIDSQRRGDGIDERNQAFISGDPVMSNIQSALEFYFDDPGSMENASPLRPFVDKQRGDRRGYVEMPIVTDRKLIGIPTPSHGKRRVFDKFSVSDPGWVSSLVAMGIARFKKPHPFNSEPAPTVVVGDICRLIVVGDWGSGIPRAQRNALEMRKHVEASLAEGAECHVVHLGDVYYSGWEYEYRDRFLPYWPVKPEEHDRVGSWCLNGNHDMYSGGFGYFDYLLGDPRFARQSKSSFFRLANNHWQLLGLDTAWDDNGLKDPQSDWVTAMTMADGLKTVLLSHHQLFSSRESGENVGKVLRAKLGRVLEAGKIDAALWGHEHRCMLFEPHENVRYGRLIGHGGVPVYADKGALLAPASFQDMDFITSKLGEHWAYMGFAVLDFDGPSVGVRYFNENGRLDKKEVLI
jgi:hypothetical protein